jgi:hypothetical protein
MTWNADKKTRRELGARGRLKAAGLLHRLRIERLEELDVEAIAFHHGLRVRYGGLTGAQGRLASIGGRGFIRVAHGIDSVQRRRYIISHELGHHLLHASEGRLSLCKDGDLLRYDAAAGDAEEEANWFAAELLMPKPLFQPRCDVKHPSLSVVHRLAEAFVTTPTATAIRFVDLAPEACAVVWSENGLIKWAIRGPEFWPWIEFGRRLGSYTHAADAFQGKPVTSGAQLVPASAWTSKQSGDIYEDTEWFSRLRATLTLLWLPSADGT